LKTHYELLGLDRGAPAEDIKRAFRREIARYHPDKVQHLGVEFQEIAATRAAELTEAYRVLMDEAERKKYDAVLAAPPAPAHAPAATAATAAPSTPTPATAPQPPSPGQEARRDDTPRRATDLFVKKAALRMLAEAVSEVAPSAAPITVRGFDAGYTLKGKRSLFGKVTPDVSMLARFVPVVDRAAVEDSWALGRTAGVQSEALCLLVLGGGLAPPPELAAAVAEQRRKTRAKFMLVPVDVRDWEALLPPETPAAVRAVLQRLREGPR
jgi:curved DNA-binding protein CbpA